MFLPVPVMRLPVTNLTHEMPKRPADLLISTKKTVSTIKAIIIKLRRGTKNWPYIEYYR